MVEHLQTLYSESALEWLLIGANISLFILIAFLHMGIKSLRDEYVGHQLEGEARSSRHRREAAEVFARKKLPPNRAENTYKAYRRWYENRGLIIPILKLVSLILILGFGYFNVISMLAFYELFGQSPDTSIGSFILIMVFLTKSFFYFFLFVETLKA